MLLVGFMFSVQVVVQGNVEVHQFGSLGIIDAGDVDMSSGDWGGDVFDIEKEKPGLGVVRLDGFGCELGGFDLVAFFVGDRALYFATRKRQRHLRSGAAVRIDEAAIDIVGRDGSQFGIVGGGQSDLHIGDGDGLVSVVGDDKEDRKKIVLMKIDGEDFRFFRRVVGIGGDGDFLVGMVVVSGIGLRRLGLRFGEVFGREGNGE